MNRTFWNDFQFTLYLAITFILTLALFGSIFTNMQVITFWLRAGDLPDKTSFAGLSRHSTLVYEDAVYIIGGSGNDVNPQSRDVYVGKINADGFIGVWGEGGSLSESLIYSPAVVTETGCIFMVGGLSSLAEQSSLSFGQATNEGQISWHSVEVEGFSPRYLHALVISGDRIYALGGFIRDSDVPLGNVDYLKISQTCTKPTSNWNSADFLNPPRAAHTAIAFEDRIYVVGGFVGGTAISNISASIQSAEIRDSGLSSWSVLTSTLPIPLAYHTTFVSQPDRRVYVLGGLMQSGEVSDKVYSAYINDNGVLIGDSNNPDKWKEETAFQLPVPLYRHTTILSKSGGLYVIGGQTKDQNGNDINQSQVYYIRSLVDTLNASSAK